MPLGGAVEVRVVLLVAGQDARGGGHPDCGRDVREDDEIVRCGGELRVHVEATVSCAELVVAAVETHQLIVPDAEIRRLVGQDERAVDQVGILVGLERRNFFSGPKPLVEHLSIPGGVLEGRCRGSGTKAAHGVFGVEIPEIPHEHHPAVDAEAVNAHVSEAHHQTPEILAHLEGIPVDVQHLAGDEAAEVAAFANSDVGVWTKETGQAALAQLLGFFRGEANQCVLESAIAAEALIGQVVPPRHVVRHYVEDDLQAEEMGALDQVPEVLNGAHTPGDVVRSDSESVVGIALEDADQIYPLGADPSQGLEEVVLDVGKDPTGATPPEGGAIDLIQPVLWDE